LDNILVVVRFISTRSGRISTIVLRIKVL